MEASENQKTILLVDDDIHIVGFVGKILTDRGYAVITANNGADAIGKSKAYPGEIALLLSDFQMPGISGVELAVQLTVDRPHLKVLLMSGFPEGMLVLNEGWHFMANPFVASQLCALILGLIYPAHKSRYSDHIPSSN